MIKQADHIINKEIFEFTYGDVEQAFSLQKEMNDDLLFNIHAVIDSALNDFCRPGEIIRINRLEIDLGEIPLQQLNSIIPSKIYDRFKEKLHTTIADRKTIDDQYPNEIADLLKTIEFFIHTGSLPWWAGPSKNFSLNEVVKFLLETKAAGLKTLLSENISNEQFIKRLVYQLDKKVYEKLFELIPPLSQSITTIRMIIDDSFDHFVQIQKTTVQGEISSLVKTSKDQPNGDISTYQKKISEQIAQNKQAAHSRIITQQAIDLIIHQSLPSTEQELRSHLKEKILILFGGSIELDKLEASIDKLITKEYYDAFKILKKEVEASVSSQKLKSNELSMMNNGEKIFIENAGLVLISTFLPALFKELQWIENGKFINKELQYRGVFLLHYMATGETAAPEYSLQLNKILAGLGLEEPIPFFIELTDKEKQEADQLLKDIIDHWSALKNSSVEGFRGSFILRDGLLSYNEGHWSLQVEKKGYDILIEHIPWSWRTVKFDWMETYIDTEW